MELTNIAYQDKVGDIKVRVDHAKCIACGRCLWVCTHNARYYEDDTKRFFADLKAGVPISLIAAPSIRTNIPEWKRLFTYLKRAGVKKIYDVSLGADICIWAHVRHIERAGPVPIVTQPCPVIVSYCEIFHHELINYLSPVHSPMACAAVYMKEYEKINDRIAALSPCIAKSIEFEAVKSPQYNVTFVKLLEYLKKKNITLPEEETGFDHPDSGFGALFPMPGGLKENIEFYLGKKVSIMTGEGEGIFKKLASYGETPDELLPRFYDVLNCGEGCNVGSGCPHDSNIFKIGAAMWKVRKTAAARDRAHYDAVFSGYDTKFDYKKFTREYYPLRTKLKKITEHDTDRAFRVLEKYDYYKQNVNCGACGSETCLGMARKIALKVNIPENCIAKAMNDAKIEHEKNIEAYKKSVEDSIIIKDTLERLETIWQNVEGGIFIVDAETRKIIDINPVAVRMFGAPKEEIIGNRCHKFICPSDTCPILDAGHSVDRSERKFVNICGEHVPIVKSVAKIHYNGKLALLENFTDISHIKEAEDQLRLKKVAEQASQAKSDFLSTMSHEMRTPMNAIIGMAKIAEKTTDVEKLRYCLSKIGDSSEHLLGLINNILDMSKIEAGKLELDAVPFNIDKMLQKVCGLFNDKIAQKNIKFDIAWYEGTRRIFIGDELRVSQVVANLLSNAVKFTPEGGRIELAAAESVAAEESGGSILRFSVTDTGIGMKQEQVSRLFNAFEQAESGTTRKYGGTGLGLAISKSIVEKMDGRIWAESEPNKGSKFVFDIKLARPGVDGTDENRTERTDGLPDFSNVRILFAEDVEINREIFITLLEETGINIDVAENGVIAVEKFTQNPGKYDLIIMDVMMPEMDGLEATRAIRAKAYSRAKTIPIIAMTANAFKEDIDKCIESGMNDHLAKPIDMDAVIEKMRLYLNK